VQIDHLVVAARTLDEGSAWVEERLGVAPVPGGKHALMGTHNRLLKLGERVYLEVIAIDPDAPAPSRPRWFALDTPEMQERLEQGPALVHWVERTEDIEEAARHGADALEVLALSRGAYRWRIGVRADGAFPGNGRLPTLIQWEGGDHPANDLPRSACALLAFDHGGARLRATFSTPSGLRTITGGE
jgi:glyoxalase-like protein